jgi:hypothetical protein
MAKQTSRIGRARTAVKTLTPVALSIKAWWDGLSEKEKARYRSQAAALLRQAKQVGQTGLDAAKSARGGSDAKKKR